MRYLIWNGLVRSILFWAIVAAVVGTCDSVFQPLDLTFVGNSVVSALSKIGTPEGVEALESLSKPAFAVSLAIGLFCTGIAILFSFVIVHWGFIRLELARLTWLVRRPKGRKAFADVYEQSIYPRLERHPLLGHAWKEFDETLLKGARSLDGVIGNTVRPQAFISYSVLRERLGGLKMLGSISGYFVGIGLLLTFAGIVLALNKAGQSVSADNVKTMQKAMQELLQIASFKFSTSIAGLGVSIIFAIGARVIVISLERGISALCDAVEHQMRYVAPQSLAVEMNIQSKEQLDQLREINSDRYFSRLADSVSPLIEAAMSRAMAPVSEQIGTAMGKLATTSQTGVGELIKQFSESVQGGAGAELKQLVATLKETERSLSQAQSAVQDSGSDFTRRIADAADNLNRLVQDAGKSLDDGAAANRTALTEIVEAMRATFERANGRIESDLGSAAAGAAAQVEGAMQTAMARLGAQVGSLVEAMQSFQQGSADGLASTRQEVSRAQMAAAETITATGQEVSRALQQSLAEALGQISSDFERFGNAMRTGSAAYAQQAGAIGEATTQTRKAADAFSEISTAVRASAAPLLQSAGSIATATADLGSTTRAAVETVEKLAVNAGQLAEGLRQRSAELAQLWATHASRFEQADQSLAGAVAELARATEDQAAALGKWVGEVDSEMARVLDRLQGPIGQIGEHTEELSEAVSLLVRTQRPAG